MACNNSKQMLPTGHLGWNSHPSDPYGTLWDPVGAGSQQDTSGATFADAFRVDFPERPGLAMHPRTRRVPRGAPQKLEPQTEASRALQ